ncbi:hypothetical protein Tsp_10661 [Trichinella spiralis]|uniref:hypothetical protein n=1 Tax=Trichinella spiralis TaxID=6334 RepID=UPI0001EFEC1D|nr:hypothetical protein Tsp_10661 [Trichinella spiralis]
MTLSKRKQYAFSLKEQKIQRSAFMQLVESRRTLSAHYANYFCLEIVSPIAMCLLPVFSTDAAWNETEAEEDFFIEKSPMSLKSQSINLIIVYWNSTQMGLKL